MSPSERPLAGAVMTDAANVAHWKRQECAIHEAGHGVVAAALGCNVEVVTIVPTDDSDGHISHTGARSISDAITIRCAGLASVRAWYRSRPHRLVSYGAGGDRAQIEAIWREGGLSGNPFDREAWYSGSRGWYAEPRRQAFIDLDMARARGILRQHWSAVVDLAYVLLDVETVHEYPLPYPMHANRQSS